MIQGVRVQVNVQDANGGDKATRHVKVPCVSLVMPLRVIHGHDRGVDSYGTDRHGDDHDDHDGDGGGDVQVSMEVGKEAREIPAQHQVPT